MPQSPAGYIVRRFVRDLEALIREVQEDYHSVKLSIGTVGMEVQVVSCDREGL